MLPSHLSAQTIMLIKHEVRDIKGAAPTRATPIIYVFGDLPEKTH